MKFYTQQFVGYNLYIYMASGLLHICTQRLVLPFSNRNQLMDKCFLNSRYCVYLYPRVYVSIIKETEKSHSRAHTGHGTLAAECNTYRRKYASKRQFRNLFNVHHHTIAISICAQRCVFPLLLHHNLFAFFPTLLGFRFFSSLRSVHLCISPLFNQQKYTGWLCTPLAMMPWTK